MLDALVLAAGTARKHLTLPAVLIAIAVVIVVVGVTLLLQRNRR
jgi:hypothetical protein